MPPSSAAYVQAVLADGASHHWRLNEATGPVAADSIGTADGQIGQVVLFNQPGALPDDAAMHFDGVSGRIAVGAPIAFTNSFSVECWVKLDSGSGAGTVLPLLCNQAGPPTTGIFYLELLDGGQTLRATIADTPTTSTFLIADTGKGLDGLIDGQWHHVVWVFPLNLPTLAVYLDGVALTVNRPPTLFYATTPIYIGYNPTSTGARYYKGLLDEVAFYPVALTAAQVAAHHTLVVPPVAETPTILIDDVDRTRSTRSTGQFQIEYQLGARGRADLDVKDNVSDQTAYRPQLDDVVRVEPNLFRGAVFSVADSPLAPTNIGTGTKLQSMDNWRYAAKRLVKDTFAAGQTLKQISDFIVAKYLGTFNILPDATNQPGPVLGEVVFDYNTVEDAFNRLAVLSSWIYRLTATDLVQWFPVGGKPRGITFSAAAHNIVGNVEWTKTQETRANRLVIRYGSGQVTKSESFVGDGVRRSFPLKFNLAAPGFITYPGVTNLQALTQSWPGVGAAQPGGLEYYQTDYPALQEYQNVWPNAVGVTPPGVGLPAGWGPAQFPVSPWFWDASNHCMVHDQRYAYDQGGGAAITPASVTVNLIAPYLALNQEGVGAEGAQLTDLYKWHYDKTTNSIVSSYPQPPRAGVAFTFEYQVQYPLDVIVEDASDFINHGILEELRTEPTIFEEAEAITFGQGLLRKRAVEPRTVNIRTRTQHDFLPGDTVQLDVPTRTLPSAPWLVTNVVISADADQHLTTRLSLLEGSEAQGSWIDFWRHVLGVSGSSTSGSAPAPPASGRGLNPLAEVGPTISYMRAGNVQIDSSGIYISPAGTGAYQSDNAVRWSAAFDPATEAIYRTAIWRSDATAPEPVKRWHFDNIQLYTDTVIVQSLHTTKLAGLGTYYGEAILKQQGKGSAGEAELLSIAHRHDGTLNADRWAGTWAWTGNQDPDQTAQFGLWTTAVGPAVGFPPDCGVWVRHAAISAHVGAASPVLIDATGAHLTLIPTCPTAPPGTSTTQIASTEFVTDAIGGGGTGGGMDLDYLGNFVTGPVYNDGDIVIAADGIAYMCVVDGTVTPPEPWPGVGIATSVGPPGPKGDKGDKGDTGATGAAGVNAAVDATYWTVSPHPTLTNERALNTLANGYVKSTAGEPSIVSIIPVAEGGTGANNPTTARANLGVGNVGTLNINGNGAYYLDGTGAWSIPPTAVGVPSGLIAIFATACPAGWTRVAGWDGRYLRAAAAYGAMGGAYSHAHGPGTLTGGSHSHAPGTYAGPSHNHGAINISGRTGSVGDHSHYFSKDFSVQTNAAADNMNVDAGGSGYMSRSSHYHQVNGNVAGDTNAGGGHDHSFSGSGTPNNDGGQTISGTSAAANVAITGATDAVDHQPPWVDVVFCQKN